MKKTLTIIPIFVLLFASFALADITLESSQVMIDVNYASFNDDRDDTIPESTDSFTLTNTGQSDVTVKVTAINLPTDYEAEEVSVNVPGNGSTDISFNIEVPHDKGEGETDIGSVIVKDDAGATIASATLTQDTRSMFELEEIEVEYTDSDGKSARDDFAGDSDDDSFELDEDVEPFSDITLTFKIKNLFDNDYDNEGNLENIELTIEADEDDIFESGFEEDYELDDLDGDKKDEFEVTFTIDEDAQEDTYELELSLEAEDSQGNVYKHKKFITLDIDRKRDDVRISNVDISPATITQCTQSVTFDVTLKNFGTDDQDFAGFSIFSNELDISETVDNIEIEELGEDDEWRESLTFPLVNTQAKRYELDFTAFVDRDDKTDSEVVSLTIGECADAVVVPDTPSTPPALEQEQEDIVVPPVAPQEDVDEEEEELEGEEILVGTGEVVKTVEDPYTTEDFIIGAIIIAVVLVVAFIIIFIILLLK